MLSALRMRDMQASSCAGDLQDMEGTMVGVRDTFAVLADIPRTPCKNLPESKFTAFGTYLPPWLPFAAAAAGER